MSKIFYPCGGGGGSAAIEITMAEFEALEDKSGLYFVKDMPNPYVPRKISRKDYEALEDKRGLYYIMDDLGASDEVVLEGVLTKGQTSITFESPLFTKKVLVDIFTTDGVATSEPPTFAGDVMTMNFEAQEKDIDIVITIKGVRA